MRLQVIGTGSSGNAYLLWGSDRAILLDAGLTPYRILREVGFDTKKIAACFITHEHGDHALAVPELSRLGVKCYGTAGTASKVKGLSSEAKYDGRLWVCDRFTVMMFDTQHDAAQPCGFLIRDNVTGSKLVYATDTYYLKYRFPGVNYWLIECNYCDEYLETTPPALRRRLETSHMSLNRLVELFKANELSSTKQIILCHISRDRGNVPLMIEKIRSTTHKAVIAADNGMMFPLDDDPF